LPATNAAVAITSRIIGVDTTIPYMIATNAIAATTADKVNDDYQDNHEGRE
jgi:hypothetical protein